MRPREVGNAQDEPLVAEAIQLAVPFQKTSDLASLVDRLALSRIVMLGESSHGTHEFYEWRRAISLELMKNHGFSFIAVEGDWPPCWSLNNFLHGQGANIRSVLHGFSRWPTWMWANEEVALLARDLRALNEALPASRKVGFFGLDVYSLFESVDAVLSEVAKTSPLLARQLRTRYECFDPFARDEIAYAKSLIHIPAGCQNAVLTNLQDILAKRLKEKNRLSSPFGDSLFNAEQNARTVANAESYYRSMITGEDSWNIRDRHMLETLNTLLERHGEGSKAIVWAHNTHVGDYRATDMLAQGQINIGGLAREKWGEDRVSLVGFGTYEGEVIAAQAWDGRIEKMPLPRGAEGSYESAFHKVAQAKGPEFWLDLTSEQAKSGPLREIRGHRAVGVVYHPAYERRGNYVPTSLADRYDHFLFFNKTSGLKPILQDFEHHEIPETWPQGM
ncbi:MAG: erythromycin esterase family protein [Bdellovibrionota bacterium]